MSAELDELLTGLLTVALHKADRVPTPSEPADTAWEQVADEYCLRAARTQDFEPFSPEVACALIPRLRIARVFASTVEHQLDMQTKLGDGAAGEREILEVLLVRFWRDSWRDKWLAGEFV